MTRRAVGLLAACVSTACVLACGGCLFETRDPEGGGGGGGVWVPPTTPEILVQNLEAALEAEIFGDYVRAFSESFTFRPDETDSVQLSIERPGEAVYVNWTKDVETQVAEAIANSSESVDLTLTFLSEAIVPEGRLRKYSYTLAVERVDGIDLYEGDAWLTVEQVGSEWSIRHWQDVITERTVESWGRLKGRNRQV